MRIPRLALMAGAMASVLFAGTAHAATVSAPAYKPALVKNPIYKTGELGLETCEEADVRSGTVDEARVYFEGVLDCLNAAWAPKVKKAGFTFAKPKFRVITKPDRRGKCGGFAEGAQAQYCTLDNTITFLLTPEIVAEPSDLQLMVTMAHEYGHHVQNLTGMIKALTPYSRKNEARFLDESRRLELQAQCFSGVFVGDVWRSLGRPDSDFDIIVKSQHSIDLSVIGVKSKSASDLTHASSAAFGRWLKRGFDAASPNVCNTWKAPKSQVS